jgi:hypothetical protein
MARMAYTTATLPLRRRLIGSLAVLAGVGVVCVGFFVTITGNITQTGQSQVVIGSTSIPVSGGTGTASDALRHLLDHGIASGSTVTTMADILYRAGVAGMAAAAILAVALLFGPARGMIGAAAGLGFIGVALAAAVTAGQSASLSTASGGTLHTDVGVGVVVLALGFVVILAGGALAAFRPLAGLVSGISLALVAVAVGIAVALIVGGSALATQNPLQPGQKSLLIRLLV